ncbi:MAG: stage III sporulation protein AA [Anaerovoracaceae bacterium]
MDTNTERIIIRLPENMQEKIKNLPENVINNFEEIRIKAGKDTLVISEGKEINLRDGDFVTPEILDELLNRLLDYSYYAYEDELSKGYITIEGGHRVGICGRVTLREGKVHIIKDISSLNIRRSRQIIGASKAIINSVLDEDKKSIKNTLIISPPKCGKTTILRDLARTLSKKGYRVGICDERSEIAGSYNGKSSYELGSRTDILDGCPKSEGINMLIRAMSPDVVITDEIGKPEDVPAVNSALCAGVKIITSIHGNSYEDVARSAVGELVTNHIFETLVFLSATPSTGTVNKILKLSNPH